MPGLEGTTLGRYYLLRRLGQGGMSEVYLARDKRNDRSVALKVVGSHAGDFIERFRRETSAISRLQHPHILPALAVGKREPWHYLVMPYIEHGTLFNLLEHGPLTSEHASELLTQIADALQFAHTKGIIHRDIKPSNILLRDDHYAYLADFGLAKQLEGSHTLTQTGILLGTPEYMAPDLAEGPATTSSDIYSLGILLYQMVTGMLPFQADTPLAVYFKQIRELPLPPSYHRQDLPPSVDSVILRALEKDPRRRFKSARALAEAFRFALANPDHIELAEVPIIAGAEQAELELDALSEPAPRYRSRSIRQTWRPERWRRAQPQKLVLPGDPTTAPTAIPTHEPQSHQSGASLPPLPLRSQTTADPLTPPLLAPIKPLTSSPGRVSMPGRSRPALRKRRSRKQVITTVLAIGIVLFVMLPMTILYCAYSLNQAKVVATPVATTAPTASTQPNQATSQAQNTATPGIVVTSGTPALSDSLSGNTAGRWAEDPTNCVFFAGAYHIRVPQASTLRSCPLLLPPLSMDNIAVQANMILNSENEGGMLLRANGPQYYFFAINNQGQFSFRRHNSDNTFSTLLPLTANPAILRDHTQNTLLVIAYKTTFELYVNGVQVGIAHDSSYGSGYFAFAANTSSGSSNSDTSFSTFKVFTLPSNLTKTS